MVKFIYITSFVNKLNLGYLWEQHIIEAPNGPRPFDKLTDAQFEQIVRDSKTKLYRNGECIEGKWEHGRLVNSISSSSFFSDVMSATKKIFSGNDTIQDKNIIEQKDMWYDGYVDEQEDLNEPSSEQEEILSSNTEIIEKINSDIEDFLSDKLNEKVSDRFGFLNLLRMYVQPWFYSDISRANSAQEYFLEDIEEKRS